MRKLMILLCAALALIAIGTDGYGAFREPEGVAHASGAGATPAPEGVVSQLVIESTQTDPIPTRQAGAPTRSPGDAMDEVTREALLIAAWILGILFVLCVVVYVLYHHNRFKHKG